MRKIIRALTGVAASVAMATNAYADNTWENAVQASATVQVSPPQITLRWPQDVNGTPIGYTIYRKAPVDTSWGNGTALSGTTTSFVDNNVAVGTTYEYQIVKNASGYVGYGYLLSGINVPLTENRGKLLLVVDNTYAAALSTELTTLQQDLTGDGWAVIRIEVNRTDSVTSVKSKIQAQYNTDPANVNCVFLFGHVPVPYSGNIVPDGHVPDHQGAWPCDGYYGDMTGTWTDNSVNITSASDPRNDNVPGDGKFDQSTFPAPIRLMVGRVDLANMPGRLVWNGPATFPNEQELLRNYLNKDHAFRRKQFEPLRRGIVGDYFGVRGGEAFAASGWRNFSAFFGATNITNLPTKGTWIPTLSNNAYLWAYGAGAGSSTSVGGLGNTGQYNDGTTTEMYQNDVKAVFTMLFGSWFGDWDSEDNIMRCVLALPSYGLTCAWSGRPHWFFHHMALGEPIGESARLTQNNMPGGLYQNQINPSAGQIHIALLGDPTLRLNYVAPPSNLSGAGTNGPVVLSWTPSTDPVMGYYVYRSDNSNGPFTRLTGSLIPGTTYIDSSASAPANYMVRAIKLENSASGTYTNLSEGIFYASTGVGGPGFGPPALGVTLKASWRVGTGLELSWNSVSNKTYRVLSKTNLNGSAWSTTVELTAAGSTTFWTDAAALTNQSRFYRVDQMN